MKTQWHKLTGVNAEIIFDKRTRTREDWEKARSSMGIGGSEIGTILDMNPWDSRVAGSWTRN